MLSRRQFRAWWVGELSVASWDVLLWEALKVQFISLFLSESTKGFCGADSTTFLPATSVGAKSDLPVNQPGTWQQGCPNAADGMESKAAEAELWLLSS